MCERKCSRPFNLCWTKFYSVRPEQISWTFIENYRTLLIDFFSVLYCSLHRRLLKTTPSHDIGPVIDYKTLNIEQLLLFSFLNLWTGWLGHSGNDGNDGTDDDDDGDDENGDDDDDGNDGAYYLKVFLKTNIDYHPISLLPFCRNNPVISNYFSFMFSTTIIAAPLLYLVVLSLKHSNYLLHSFSYLWSFLLPPSLYHRLMCAAYLGTVVRRWWFWWWWSCW